MCVAASVLSCTKESDLLKVEDISKAGEPMTFNISVLETKANKTAWANTDKIYVFFKGLETKYLILEYDGSSWSNTSGGGTLLSTDFEGLGVKTITAVHFPLAVDVSYADSKFSFTSGGTPIYNYYLYEADKSYTVEGTEVNATLELGKPVDFAQFHVEGIQSLVADYTFGCSLIKPVACSSVSTDGTIAETVLQAGARLSAIADSDGGIFAGRLTSPGVAANYLFSLASDDNIYTLTRDSKTLTAGKMYNFPAPSVTGGSNWEETAAEELYVDLGLSVKWAKHNLGASDDSDYGDPYAWGELHTKDVYSWGTYYFNPSGNGSTFTKYTGSDYSVLQPEDDAAYAMFGGKFRMPTTEEWVELVDNCTWSRFTLNGVTVMRATSNKTGYTDRSIILPTASGSAYYWSSSLMPSPDDVYVQYTYSWKTGLIRDPGRASRYEGERVRPVTDLSHPEMVVNGKFTINASGDQVYFSQGNLQYYCSTSTPKWRFAEYQYDYLAYDNSAYAENSGKWIDLFAYGTSGYDNGQANYQPWKICAGNGWYSGSLTGNADWGYNRIENGGDTENSGWRTLTKEEWLYLFQNRANAASKYGFGSVNGTNGIILLPDSWTLPDGLSFTAGTSAWTNSYAAAQWNQMENAGAVFLPASGSCNASAVPSESTQNAHGFYRSSTYAYYLHFASNTLDLLVTSYPQYGDAVRLVKPAIE